MAEDIKEPVVEPELEQASTKKRKATENIHTLQLDEIIQKEKAKAAVSAEKSIKLLDEAESYVRRTKPRKQSMSRKTKSIH